MNDEYISIEDVLSYIYATHSSGGFKREDDYLWLHDKVINAASADVQPVKHGKWDFQGYQLFKCTNCKEMFTQDQLEAMQNHIDCEECAFPNFCPNCGARMDGNAECQ